MLPKSKLEELAKTLAESVPPAARHLCQDLESNFKSVLQAAFGKLDLVNREEFDAQKGVLERTRAKLTQLEKKVSDLEQQHDR